MANSVTAAFQWEDKPLRSGTEYGPCQCQQQLWLAALRGAIYLPTTLTGIGGILGARMSVSQRAPIVP